MGSRRVLCPHNGLAAVRIRSSSCFARLRRAHRRFAPCAVRSLRRSLLSLTSLIAVERPEYLQNAKDGDNDDDDDDEGDILDVSAGVATEARRGTKRRHSGSRYKGNLGAGCFYSLEEKVRA